MTLFDGKFFGYLAIGQDIIFRPMSGPDVSVFTCPSDVDSHLAAASLNSAANGVTEMMAAVSAFKF